MKSILSPNDLLSLQKHSSEVTRNVGEFVFGIWEDEKDVSYKAGNEPVTAIDIEAEKRLMHELGKLLPEAGFILEEGDDDPKGQYNWAIDPIDQTKNFIGGIPLFFVQIALLDNGDPILSIIYNPISSQVFSASRGNGAFLNGKLLKPKTQDNLGKALVDVEMGGNYGNPEWKIDIVSKLIRNSYRTRITGGAFSTGLLTGGIDAFVVLNEKTKIMDQMPRICLYREAGLKVQNFDIKGNNVYVATNQNLLNEIIPLLK